MGVEEEKLGLGEFVEEYKCNGNAIEKKLEIVWGWLIYVSFR